MQAPTSSTRFKLVVNTITSPSETGWTTLGAIEVSGHTEYHGTGTSKSVDSETGFQVILEEGDIDKLNHKEPATQLASRKRENLRSLTWPFPSNRT